MIEFDLPPYLPEPPLAAPPPDADIPPEAFGARQAAALAPESIDDPLYRREAATANATRAEELNNDFIGRQREILQTGPDAFYRRQGRDAILAAPDVIGRLNAAQDEVLGRAETPSQRAMLSQILDNHMLVTHYGIGSHVGRQSLEWQKGVAQARLEQLHEQARQDYGDQDSIANYADAGEAAAQDHTRLSGLPPDSDETQARAAGARSAIYRTAIESALEANDHSAASTLHEQAQGSLTPADAAVIEPQMKATAEVETARDYLGRIAPPSSEPAANFDASRLMTEADAAHQAATEQNNTDWADNPSQRATNQHHIDVQFGLQKRGIEQAKAQLDGKVTDWLTQPMPDGQPQINRPPLALWTQLSPEQQNGVDAALAQNARGANTMPPRAIPDQPASDETIMSDASPEELEDGQQYAQAGAGRVTRRGPGGRDLTPMEEVRSENFGSHLKEIRKLEPQNRELEYAAPTGWVPSERVLARVHEELLRVRQRAAEREFVDAQRKANTARGSASEARVRSELGLPKNTQPVRSPKGASIPDVMTDTRSIEIKDRAYVSLTRQLQIQAEAAKGSSRLPVLITGERTKISEQVQKTFKVFRRSDLGPQQ
jgi:hypothetical protein